jgi:tRNA (cmo5U34)-methyltransferase
MSTDNIIPNGKWEFNEDVSQCFEDMLARSIPQYDVMRDAVFSLGVKILDKHKVKNILDIGCSDGLGLERFVRHYGALCRYKGIDVSEPMLEQARKRFEGLIKTNFVSINCMDLRIAFPLDRYSLILSILTIQFIPIEYRQSIIQKIYDHLEPNGALLMVEKVLGNCNELNEIMVDEYLNMKEVNGYTREQIERKRLSLEGVLVPVTSNWNVDLLKQAGFRKIDVFWRWMNFEGYIAIK